MECTDIKIQRHIISKSNICKRNLISCFHKFFKEEWNSRVCRHMRVRIKVLSCNRQKTNPRRRSLPATACVLQNKQTFRDPARTTFTSGRHRRAVCSHRPTWRSVGRHRNTVCRKRKRKKKNSERARWSGATDQTREISVPVCYVQRLKHIHTHRWYYIFFVLKSREIHQGFRAFEKPFNDPSRDID